MAEPLILSVDFDDAGAKKRLEEIKIRVEALGKSGDEAQNDLAKITKELKEAKASADALKDSGVSADAYKAIEADIRQMSTAAEEYRGAIQNTENEIRNLRIEYQQLSQEPLLNEYALQQGREEAQELSRTLKGVGEQASQISFERLDISKYSGEAAKLAADVNKATYAYEAQKGVISSLEARLATLTAIKREQAAQGVVSPAVTSEIATLKNNLEAARIKLETLGQAADTARTKLDKAMSGGARGAKDTEKGVDGAGKALQRFKYRLESIIQRMLVFRLIYSAFNKLKEVISSVTRANSQLGESFARVKGNLAVAFQPLVNWAIPILEKVTNKLERLSAYFVLFVSRLTGRSVQDMIASAEDLNQRIAKSNEDAAASYKKQIKAIDEQISAYNKQIKAIRKTITALEDEYKAQKKVYDKQKDALKGQIKEIDKYISQLRKQEKAEKRVVQAQKAAFDEQIANLKAQKNNLTALQRETAAQYDAQSNAIKRQIKAVDDEIKAIQKLKAAREAELKANQKVLASFDTLNVLETGEEDPEIAAYDAQIEALEDKKDALRDEQDIIAENKEVAISAIQAEIDAVEAQIVAIEKLKSELKEVDYSEAIEAQQEVIEGINAQIEKIDEIASRLREEHELKIEVEESAIGKIQDQIDKLSEEKEELSRMAEAAKESQATFTTSLDRLGTELDDVSEKFERFANSNFFIVIEKIVARLREFSDWAEENPEKFKKIHDVVELFLKMLAVYSVGKFLWGLILKIGLLTFSLGLLVLAIGLVFIAWDDMTKLEKAIAVISILIAVCLAAAIAVGALQSSWSLGIAAAAIVAGIIAINAAVRGAKKDADSLYSGSTHMSSGSLHGGGGGNFGIPALAGGAVLPGGKPFLAILGDQPSGQTNIEAPLDTIVAAFKAAQRDIDVNVNFTGALSQLARMLAPEIEVAQHNKTAF